MMFYKGGNFYGFLFAFLHKKSFLKRGLLKKARICSLTPRHNTSTLHILLGRDTNTGQTVTDNILKYFLFIFPRK